MTTDRESLERQLAAMRNEADSHAKAGKRLMEELAEVERQLAAANERLAEYEDCNSW